jgi:ferredoxin-type protein NapF
MTLSRRGFLRGRLQADRGEDIRPPWAIGASTFELACTRCGACVEACPQTILKPGDGGFPRVDFKTAGCSFCGDCVAACEPQVLRRPDGGPPWSLRVSVSPACLPQHGVECRVCGEICEANAIRFRPRLGGVPIPEVLADPCTGCGACVAPCPAGAIAMESVQ